MIFHNSRKSIFYFSWQSQIFPLTFVPAFRGAYLKKTNSFRFEAEIIPFEPEQDNACEGKKSRFSIYISNDGLFDFFM